MAGVAGIQAAEPGGDGVCRKSSSPSVPGIRPGDPGDHGGLGWSYPSHSAGTGGGTAVKKMGCTSRTALGTMGGRPQRCHRVGVGFAPKPGLCPRFPLLSPATSLPNTWFSSSLNKRDGSGKGCESCPQHSGGSRVSPRSGSGSLSLRQDPAVQTCSPQLRSQDRFRPFPK